MLSQTLAPASPPATKPTGHRKWDVASWWFSDKDSTEDRRIITKLDLLIVPFSVLSCWTKYIDMANLNNAYVSGLKDDLGFHGSELVNLQTIYYVGALAGQLPFLFIFPLVRMHLLVPTLDVAWGVFTLLQYRSHSFAELAAYRFLIGCFEGSYLPAMNFIFGSWYRRNEIARRGGIFSLGNSFGTLTASVIQAGASARLDRVHGLAGWRWAYIVCALVTIPIGIVGYFLLPGTPDKPNLLFLSQDEVDSYKRRLESAGHATSSEKVTWRTFKRLGGSAQFWILVLLNVLFWNAALNAKSGGYLLWLKSLGRYSTAETNALGTIVPAVGIFYILFIGFLSDLLTGPAWAITISHLWNISGLIIQVIWVLPEAALWFAFITTYSSVAMASVLNGWVNNQMRASHAERSLTLVFVNVVAQSSILLTLPLVFPTTEAPRFTKGYSFVLGAAISLVLSSLFLHVWLKRQPNQPNTHDSLSRNTGEVNGMLETGR
ncbi:putative MFS transporter [Xylaria telfairii]|nr:putative MFS transporter [Xylaria telfairii]